MLVRGLRSSFAARRFFCSSSVSESSIFSTVAAGAEKPPKTKVPKQNTDSKMPAIRLHDFLGGRLFHMKNSDSVSAADVIAKWKDEGGLVCKIQIVSAIRGLIKHRRYEKALMICDSMLKLKDIQLNAHDYGSHIGLIYRARGLKSAENFYDNIPRIMIGTITSTALLRVLVKEGESVKAEVVMEKMRESGYLSSPRPYMHMLSLYFSNGQFDKAEKMIYEVTKRFGPNLCVYSMQLGACASRGNVGGAERAFAQMKYTKVEPDWLTYATLAGMYFKNNMFQKTSIALMDMERVAPPVAPRSVHVYCSLISMHGKLGNRDEVMRIWGKLISRTKRRSDDEYRVMVHTLVKLDLFEKAKEIIREWRSFLKTRSSCTNLVFHASLMFLKNHEKRCKMSPCNIGVQAEEDRVESKAESDLGMG